MAFRDVWMKQVVLGKFHNSTLLQNACETQIFTSNFSGFYLVLNCHAIFRRSSLKFITKASVGRRDGSCNSGAFEGSSETTQAEQFR